MDQNQAQAVSNLFPVIVQALTTIAALLAAFAAFHAASKSSKTAVYQAVIENADFVRYIVIFRGLYSSFSYTFPTSIKTLYKISSLLYLLRCTFLHKHNIVINISDSLTAYDRLYSITHHIKNVNKNIDKSLSFAYYYVTVLLY